MAVDATTNAQTETDSYWRNKGANQRLNWELGESYKDIGAEVSVRNYLYPSGHPYASYYGNIIAALFDAPAMDDFIRNTLGDTNGLQQHNEAVGLDDVCAWYLNPGDGCSQGALLRVERFTINGAPVQLRWDPDKVPQDGIRHLFVEFLSNAREPHQLNTFGPPQPVTQPSSWFDGKPYALPDNIEREGHYHVQLYENYGNDTYQSLQVAAQAIFWLRYRRQPALDFGRVYAFGGSWGAATSNVAALLMPRLFYAAHAGGMLTDFPTDMSAGAFRRLVAHMQAGINAPVWTTPPRPNVRLYQASFAQAGAANNLSDNIVNFEQSELGAFSLMRRAHASRDEVKIRIFGLAANCDLHTNLHWFRAVMDSNPLTAGWVYEQFPGHGEYGEGPNNRFSFYTGNELSDLLGHATAYTGSNPSVNPTTPVTDPFPNPYEHTLQHIPDQIDYAHNQSFPLVVRRNLTDTFSGATMAQIGQGVFPGMEDSMFVGNADNDSGTTEVIFGNFDGFLHVMQVYQPSGQPPYLEDRWRSPPLPWGVFAVDVYAPPNGGKFILAGTGNGLIYKVLVQGTSFASPTPFYPSSLSNYPTPELGKGPLSYLKIGNFSNSSGNEVLVQNEFGQFVLISNAGVFLAKTDRHRDASTGADNFIGMAGKPVYADVDGDGYLEALVPGMDGHVHQIDWVGSPNRLVVSTYRREYTGSSFDASGFGIAPDCAAIWDDDTSYGNGFYMVLGGKGGSAANQAFLAQARLDPATKLMSSLIQAGVSVVPDLVNILKWDTVGTSGGTLLACSKNTIVPVSVTATTITKYGSAPTPIIPGISGNSVSESTPLPVYTDQVCSARIFGDYLFVSTPNGRIFIMNDVLPPTFTRVSSDAMSGVPGTPEPWPANRTLAYAFGADVNPLDKKVWILDEVVAYRRQGGLPFNQYFRSASINPDPLLAGPYDPRVSEHLNEESLNNGRLRHRDLDLIIEDSALKARTFYEDGDAGDFDFDDQPETPPVRKAYAPFGTQNITVNPPTVAGYIYENDEPAGTVDPSLTNFDVPTEPGMVKYAYLASPKYPGQISTHKGLTDDLYRGVSLQIADLPNLAGVVRKQIITGTIGGFVYAVDPTVTTYPNGLTHSSNDFGWLVTGLDVGDLDNGFPGGDAHNEVVVGTFLDKGSYLDYLDPTKVLTHNRGHLYILDTVLGQQAFNVDFDITLANDSVSPKPFSAGVFGVKIDDINDDGRNEIWVGDGAGYLYALYHQQSSGNWKCCFRTKGLGTYVGVRNKIFPWKDPGTNETEALVVMTCGYVYLFDVIPQLVPND